MNLRVRWSRSANKRPRLESSFGTSEVNVEIKEKKIERPKKVKHLIIHDNIVSGMKIVAAECVFGVCVYVCNCKVYKILKFVRASPYVDYQKLLCYNNKKKRINASETHHRLCMLNHREKGRAKETGTSRNVNDVQMCIQLPYIIRKSSVDGLVAINVRLCMHI